MSRDFTEVTEELRTGLIGMIGEIIQGPVGQAVEQLRIIAGRKDLSEEQKLDMLKRLQAAMVEPFAAAAVSVALSTRMDLPTMLFTVGSAWDEIRGKVMAEFAKGMLNKEDGDGDQST